MNAKPIRTKPVLLFNDECAVCRGIASWVRKSDKTKSGETSMIVRPIGDDPEALRPLNADLSIWDAYAVIHLIMPDGSMKLGGEAVAEVFRDLPNTKWFAWSFAISLFGFRPFQALLNAAYVILADARPIFGCESCGRPNLWVRPFAATIKWAKGVFGGRRLPAPPPHSTSLRAARLSKDVAMRVGR